MEQFKRVQNKLTPGVDSVIRAHVIPKDVYRFAIEAKMNDGRDAGQGRGNLPTLADIYYQLALEGLYYALHTAEKLVFEEVEKWNSASVTQVIFPNDIDAQLRAFKSSIEQGAHEIKAATKSRTLPGGTTYDYQNTKTLSLTSLAVNLMRFAIAEREKAAI